MFAREMLRELEVKRLVRDADDDLFETGSIGTSSFSLGEAISRKNLGLEKGLKKKTQRPARKTKSYGKLRRKEMMS